jgi:hypothetical protein
LVQGPLRVSIGVGTTEVPQAEAAAHGFPYFDDASVAMSQTLAENMKKSLMNHPEIKLTVRPRYLGHRSVDYGTVPWLPFCESFTQSTTSLALSQAQTRGEQVTANATLQVVRRFVLANKHSSRFFHPDRSDEE